MTLHWNTPSPHNFSFKSNLLCIFFFFLFFFSLLLSSALFCPSVVGALVQPWQKGSDTVLCRMASLPDSTGQLRAPWKSSNYFQVGSPTVLINKCCQLLLQFVMTDVFFRLTSRTESHLKQVCMLWGCQQPAMAAVVKMQTSAHSGVIFEPLKLGQVV